MEELLKKSNVNDIGLRYYLSTLTSKSLTDLTKPCFYPKFKKDYYELLELVGLDEDDIVEFISRFYPVSKKSGTGSWKIVLDNTTNLIVFIMYYFLKKNDKQSFFTSLLFFIIKQYSNVFHRQFPFCQNEHFRNALENLSWSHLYSREKGIPNALVFLAHEIQKKYDKSIKNADMNGIVKMIVEVRNRISQSVKSFAHLYYESVKSGGIKEIGDEGQPPIERWTYLIDDICKKISVYNYIDTDAYNKAVQLSRISKEASSYIIKEIYGSNKLEYIDNIRIIIKLFVKEITSTAELCEKTINILKKLLRLRTSIHPVFFKQQVDVLSVKILQNLNLKYNINTVSSFIAFYICLLLRNHMCHE